MLIFVFTLLGFFVGSFLNVCIDRLPRSQSIIRPPSHCPDCNANLSITDLIPLIGYIRLRGKCRYCGSTIPFRVPVIEAVTALVFTLLFWRFGLGFELAMFLVYASIFIIIFVIDLEHHLVLNVITYPAMVLAFAFSFFWPGIRTFSVFWPELGVESALFGGAIGTIVMALPYLVYKGGMGIGDIKLGALLGLMTGFPLIIMVVILSWISGGLVASILLLFKIKGRKEAIPFAPFLIAAAVVTLLWGKTIYQWYL